MNTTLRRIEERDLEKIMAWRMDPNVTKYMKTDPKLTLEGQKAWLKKIETDDTVMYWLIEAEGIPAGIICLLEINWENKTSSWGYYIGEKNCRSLKRALSLEMSLYDFVFDELKFESLNNEVFVLNEGVIRLHEACGSKVSFIVKDEIEKNGELFDIAHINITREEWRQICGNKRYENITFPFPMRIHHIGYAVSDLEKSAETFRRLGYHQVTAHYNDTAIDVAIIFMKHNASGELIELVAPLSEQSPVSGCLRKMNQMASPYHICYETPNVKNCAEWLKQRGFLPLDQTFAASAINGRRATFLMQKDAGMIELLQEEKE